MALPNPAKRRRLIRLFVCCWTLHRFQMYRHFAKRIIDIVASGLCLIVFSPIMAIIALLIYLQDFANPIFQQKRVGFGQGEFTIYKFRSMPINTTELASKDAGKIQATPFGSFIRRTNLDELPQLINIFRGDMSLVGPRPSLISQTELIKLRRQKNVYVCRPGLTGWAQVNGYDDMPEDEKSDFDGEYANGVSFWFDCKIILRTFVYLTKKPPRY